MPAVQLAVAVVDALALLWLVAGLLRALRGSVVELPKWPLAFAIISAVWLLGTELARLPWRYHVMEGSSGIPGIPGLPAVYTTALVLPSQLVSAAAIACTLGAIGTMASRRGPDPLRTQARVILLMFVLLVAPGIVIHSWLGSVDANIGLAVAGANVVALALAAWLLGRAAANIDQESEGAP
jgi:hypothetical protein